jgi:hypothetical protein
VRTGLTSASYPRLDAEGQQLQCVRHPKTNPRASARIVGGSRRPFSFVNERAPKPWIVEYHSVLATRMFQRSTFLCLNPFPLATSPEQDPAPAWSIALLMHLYGRTLQEAGFSAKLVGAMDSSLCPRLQHHDAQRARNVHASRRGLTPPHSRIL